MAYDTSAVRTVIDALYDLLVARAGLTGVPIQKYAVTSKFIQHNRQYIVLANRVDVDQTYRAAGRGVKHEDFTISGEVITFDPEGDDDAADAALTRAEAWLAEIEDLLRTSNHLGLPKVMTEFGGVSHQFFVHDNGRINQSEFTVNVKAHMTTH